MCAQLFVGWNDFGTHSTDLDAITPTMTTLAESGVRLTQYYGQSLCTPARAALHSGKFVHRTGFTTLTMEIEITAFSNYSVPLKHKLLAQRLADDAGYATTFIGKWNIGHCDAAYLPRGAAGGPGSCRALRDGSGSCDRSPPRGPSEPGRR